MKPTLHTFLTILCGALLTFSYAPFSIWPLMPVLFSGFLYLLIDSKSGFKTGWLFGLGWFGAGISWVHVSIAEFGGLPLIASIALMAILCAYLALFPALFAWILKRFVTKSNWLIAAPVVWFFIEWLRSWLLTGFPWLSLGYSQIDSPLAGWMPIIGETGVSMLLVALAMSMALAVKQKQLLSPAIAVIVSFLAGWIFNQYAWVETNSKPVSIAMVQGNVKQEMRWAPEQAMPTMRKYQQMTDDHWQNQLIIWPEAAIPQLESSAESFLIKLDEQAANNDTGLITGIVNYNFNSAQVFNNLIAVGKQSVDDTQGHYHYEHANRYGKHHLLPIGEFIPFESWLRELAPIFNLPMSSFTRGEYLQPNLLSNGISLAPAICFEIAFPRQVSSNLADQTDFIITVSNDAWFGASHGPHQHLEIAQARAKEFGLPVLRATNNGITAFVDHQGEIINRLPQFEAGVISAAIPSTEGKTPYRMFGDTPLWVISLLVTLLLLWRRRKA